MAPRAGGALGLPRTSAASTAAAASAPTAQGRTRSRISTSRGAEIQRHARPALKDSLAVAGEPARRRTVAITRASSRGDSVTGVRSEEHTSERHGYISYAVFCLKKKKKEIHRNDHR